MTTENKLELTCARCKHNWVESLDRLEEERVDMVKDILAPRKYRVRCPNCSSAYILTVRGSVEE